MNLNFSKNLSRLFDNKKFLAVFSIVVAVVFWLVIEIAENPSRDVTVSEVPVTLIEKQDDNEKTLVPVGEYSDKVTVIVKGPGYIVGTVSKDDISVSVKSYKDVEKPGTYTLSLEATVNKSGCTAEPSPNFIQVQYDYISEAEIPVEVDVSEFVFSATDREVGRSVLKNNSDDAELSTLHISGPSEVVSKVAKVVVKPLSGGAAFEEKTTNFDNKELVFYDQFDQAVEDASLLVYNTDTYVRVVVYKTAEVPLKPTFTNLPAYYSSTNSGLPKYKLRIYDEIKNKYQTVSSVTVKGPVDTVDSLLTKGLELAPIDFSKVKSGNTKFNVSFVLADGVSVVDGTEEITVALDLGTLTTKTVTIEPSNIKFTGLAQGFTVGTSYKKGIKVVLCGRSAALSKVSASDITISVDCSSITVATVETKALKVTVAASVEAWATSSDPTEISITVN